jgi:hypothetical protein
MALVNTLQIRLDAVTGGLQKGLNDASKSIDGFLQKNRTLGDVLGNLKTKILAVNPAAALAVGAVAGIGLAATNAVKQAISLANEMTTLSLRTGETTETLSQLKFVAEQNEVQFGALQVGLRFLNRNVGEAVTGNKRAQAAFKALGIDVRDANGEIKKGSQVLEDLATEIAKIPDAATRTSRAQALLGRGAQQLLPILALGGEGIRKWREEADRFGATISTQFAMQADDYSDNLAKIKTIQQGLGVQLAQVVVPQLNKLLLTILPIAQQAIPLFGQALSGLAFLLDKTITLVQLASTAVFGLWSALRGDRNGIKVVGERIDELGTRLFQSKAAFEAEAAAALKSVPGVKAAGDAHEEAATSVSGLTTELEKLAEAGTLFEDPIKRAAEAARARAAAAEERRRDAEAAVEFAEGAAFRSKKPREPLPEPDLTPLPVPEIEDGTEAIQTFGQEVVNVGIGFGEVARLGAEAFGAIGNFAGGLGDALVASATGAKTAFSDFFKGLAKQLAAAIARAIILRAILSLGGGIGSLIGKVQGFLNVKPLETPGFDAFAKGEGARFGMLFGTGARAALASTALQGIAAAGPGTAQVQIQPRIVVTNAGPMAKVEWFERGQEQRLRRRQTELGGEAL